MSEPTPVLELDAVCVDYRTGSGFRRGTLSAVVDVSLTVAAGQTVGLVGESGSGKSTTGMVAVGLRRPTSGRVMFDGAPMTGPRRDRNARGAVQAVLKNPQSSLDPRMRIASSVAEPLAILGTADRAECATRVGEALADVGLDASLADRYPHELSGGQQQRVAIARALITRPRFILFDESVSALDVSVQAQILNLVKQLQAEHGFAALFITHDLDVVRYIASQIVVMSQGRAVESAPVEEFFHSPAHPYSRQLLEARTS